jgi:conjugal transfer mating pair stabilization protein TraG
MDYIIYSYGGGTYLPNIFNAVAAFTNGNTGKLLVSTVATFTVIKLLFEFMIKGSFQLRPLLLWIGTYSVLTGLFIVPKTDVWLKDVIQNTTRKVSNVPMGLALPTSFAHQIGYGFTQSFEQLFTPVDYAPYHKYGMVFGSELFAASRGFKIQGANFYDNMFQFINECVKYDALNGRKYTKEDLRRSDDVWSLVKSKSSNIFGFNYRDDQGNRNIVSCRAGAQQLEKAWAKETENLARKYVGRLFQVDPSKAGDNQYIKSAFLKSLDTGYKSSFTGMRDAESMLRQQLMINALRDSNISFNKIRALNQQRASSIMNGELAREALPIMKTLLEGLIYSAFIFICPLIVASGGWKIFLNYIGIIFWLQMWAPLYAVLNLMIYGHTKTSTSGFSTLTMENMLTMQDIHANAASIASGMMILLPMISYQIFRGSAASLSNMTTSMLGPVQAAAQNIGQEIATGNMSYDNVNVGNFQRGMQNAFAANLSSSFNSGGFQVTSPSGTVERTTMGGGLLFQSGAGLTTSAGTTRVNFRENELAQLNKSEGENFSQIEANQKAWTEAQRRTFDKTANIVEQYAKHESLGNTINYEELGSEGKMLQHAVNVAKNLHERQNTDWNQAAQVGVNAALNAGVGVGAANGSIGVSAGASVGKGNTQSLGESNDISKHDNIQQNLENLVKAASNEQFAKSKGIDTHYASDVRDSYQEQKGWEKSLTLRQEAAKQFNDHKTRIQSADIGYDAEKYQAMQDYIARVGNVSQAEAHEIMEHKKPGFKQYYDSFVNAEVGQNPLINKARQIENNINNDSYKQREQELFGDKEVSQNVEDGIIPIAKNKGIDVKDPEFIDYALLNQKAKNLIVFTGYEIENQLDTNQEKFNNLKHEVDQEQDKRSWISKHVTGRDSMKE